MRTVQRGELSRSRRELSNEYLLAKFGFDTAENEPYHFEISSSRVFEFELQTYEPLSCNPTSPSRLVVAALRQGCIEIGWFKSNHLDSWQSLTLDGPNTQHSRSITPSNIINCKTISSNILHCKTPAKKG